MLETVALVSVSGCQSKHISISAARAALLTTALNLNIRGRHQVKSKTRREAARQVHPSQEGDFFFSFFFLNRSHGTWSGARHMCCAANESFYHQLIRSLAHWKADNVQGDLISNMMNGDTVRTSYTLMKKRVWFHTGLALLWDSTGSVPGQLV